jgi:3,4-dihydroxy 2-butanone 4-phosphate synthase / GTP cyclohydrolase II
MIAAAERFAAGEPVLLGSRQENRAFVACAADTINAAALERLHRLGGGIVVLALDDPTAERLALSLTPAAEHLRLDLPFTPSIDAVRARTGGWSLAERALTMRVAADPHSARTDLRIPGHVHPVRIADDQLVRHGGAIAASLELAVSAGRRAAVALCVVVDRAGVPVPMAEALGRRDIGRLPLAATEELRGLARARAARELAVECSLPTRTGDFRAVAYGASDAGGVMIALVHGEPVAGREVLVHVHAGCVMGDAFGSLLCPCRRELERAVTDIAAAGAGVVLYVKAELSASLRCQRERAVDAGLAAGLLARAGVSRLRLEGRAWLAGELRALGLEVAHAETLVRAA